MVREKGVLPGKTVSRMTFTEVTRKAVLEAWEDRHPPVKAIADAYLVRSAIDYLSGIPLSVVLQDKLSGLAAKSIGVACPSIEFDEAH